MACMHDLPTQALRFRIIRVIAKSIPRLKPKQPHYITLFRFMENLSETIIASLALFWMDETCSPQSLPIQQSSQQRESIRAYSTIDQSTIQLSFESFIMPSHSIYILDKSLPISSSSSGGNSSAYHGMNICALQFNKLFFRCYKTLNLI